MLSEYKYTLFNRAKFLLDLQEKRLVDQKIRIREAAKQIGISAATLSRLENGQTPDVYTFFYCCKWLGISMESYFK